MSISILRVLQSTHNGRNAPDIGVPLLIYAKDMGAIQRKSKKTIDKRKRLLVNRTNEIIEYIKQHKHATRAELMSNTTVPRDPMTHILTNLVSDGVLLKVKQCRFEVFSFGGSEWH